MATNFPTSLDSLTNPAAGDSLSSPSHSAQHSNVNDAVEALQAKVGVDGSAVTSSLDYKVANQGLTLVKSQAVGASAISSLQITGCFSSTFDNYRVVYSGIKTSASGDVLLRLLNGTTPSTTGYYRTIVYVTLSTNAVLASSGINGPQWSGSSVNNTAQAHAASFDLLMPYQTEYTNYINGSFFTSRTDVIGAAVNGNHQVASSYDGIELYTSGITFSNGTVRVYGYNNG